VRPPDVSSSHSWKQSRPGPSVGDEKEPVQARRSHQSSTDYIMGRVPAQVRDCSCSQLLNAPGELHVLDHGLARSGHRHATRNPKRRDLWRNPSRPWRIVSETNTLPPHIALSSKQGPRVSGNPCKNLARPSNSLPKRLPQCPRGTIKGERQEERSKKW
jgi:hypothetical protein